MVDFGGNDVVSLTSLRTNRISGPRNFRSSAKKDFFNTIGTKQTGRGLARMSASEGSADIAKSVNVLDL